MVSREEVCGAEADSLGLRMYVGGDDSSVKPIKVYLCVRSPSVSYHISTDTLAIETAALHLQHYICCSRQHFTSIFASRKM